MAYDRVNGIDRGDRPAGLAWVRPGTPGRPNPRLHSTWSRQDDGSATRRRSKQAGGATEYPRTEVEEITMRYRRHRDGSGDRPFHRRKGDTSSQGFSSVTITSEKPPGPILSRGRRLAARDSRRAGLCAEVRRPSPLTRRGLGVPLVSVG